MREIKFRFWKHGQMCNDFDGWSEDVSTNRHFEYAKENEIPVMQYTELKDKNGKDIYEGDIGYFDISKNVPTIIKIENGAVNYWSLFNMGHKFEVVGNIYENPELLNAATN